MKPVDEELLLEKLIEDIKNCRDLTRAKELLFSICQEDAIVEKAVDYCIKSHEGQVRKAENLMQFIPSWLQAWLLLSENKATILAALLHDVIEDTQCTEEELRDQFGSEVLKLVLGLTKIVEIRR